MDVSNRENRIEGLYADEADEPRGSELFDTVVSLTDLPAPQVQKELDGILTQAGCRSDDLTLEDLRAAMLAYLETIQAEMEAEGSFTEAGAEVGGDPDADPAIDPAF